MKEHLQAGGLIVYPTTTLPGLGCLPTKEGLDNLFSTKSRPDSMPVSLGVANLEQVSDLVIIPNFLNELLGSFTDGGITTILPAITPLDQRLGGANVAVRVFAHPEAIKLASNVGAITATSANESGIAPECDTEEAAKKLGIQNFVPGTCPNGVGSTYIRLEEDGVEERGWRLTVMREGVVPQADVMKWWTIPV